MQSSLSLQQETLPNLNFTDYNPIAENNSEQLFHGLTQSQKVVDPKYFYDELGSELFDQITTLPEYYPTRTEIGLLNDYKADIANYIGKDCILFEPGSGSSEKVRHLLNALQPKAYIPLDISAEFLYKAAEQLARDYDWLPVHAICADFSDQFELPSSVPTGRRVAFYPGSTIGNFKPEQALEFLRRIRHLVGEDGALLIGVDLQKDENILHAAYNDSQGTTAAFNRNVLKHVNRILKTDFDLAHFEHDAFYNHELNRIEMHLVSQREHTIQSQLGEIRFSHKETIHTENSYKYTVESFSALATEAGFSAKKTWLDNNQLFSVNLFEAC